MTEDLLKVGLIGTSWWADWCYLPVFQRYPHAQLVAICGRNRVNAEAMAAKYAIPQVFSSYQEMIARAGLQAVIIATPDDQHHAMTLEALSAGLHVVCEKPLARSAAQAREVCAAAVASGRVHMTFFTYRWLPQFRYLKELIDQGYIGRPRHADLHFVMSYAADGMYRWRFDADRANGALGDLGSHMIDLARWYMGDVCAVSAHLATFVARAGSGGQPVTPANDMALLLLEMGSGAQASLHISAVGHTPKDEMRLRVTLYGDAGTIEADLLRSHLRGARAGGAAEELPPPDALWGSADRDDPFSVLFSEPVGVRLFLDAAREQRAVRPDFSDGLAAQIVVDAALASHASGRRVAISELAA